MKDPVAVTYEDCMGMLDALCRQIASRSTKDFEDIRSLANERFMICYEKYDLSRGVDFLQFLKTAVRHAIIDEQRKECYRQTALPRTDADLNLILCQEQQPTLQERLQTLSENAQIVYDKIIETSQEILDICPRTRPMPMSARERRVRVRAIQAQLRNAGWSTVDITNAFQELAEIA